MLIDSELLLVINNSINKNVKITSKSLYFSQTLRIKTQVQAYLV